MNNYDRLKRCLDIAITAPALVISSPLQAAVAIAVRRQLGSPVLFRQTRLGLHEKPFTLFKFRTMRNPRYPDEPDADRMTRMGTILRSTSLDELPSLLNVLQGDMSIVGPRPLLVEYLDLYTPEQRRRHQVRPGVTGLAQVSGRNAISWEDRFAFDVEYVERRTLQLDFEILLRTLLTVLRREGVSADGEATMSKFTGTTSGYPSGDYGKDLP